MRSISVPYDLITILLIRECADLSKNLPQNSFGPGVNSFKLALTYILIYALYGSKNPLPYIINLIMSFYLALFKVAVGVNLTTFIIFSMASGFISE